MRPAHYQSIPIRKISFLALNTLPVILANAESHIACKLEAGGVARPAALAAPDQLLRLPGLLVEGGVAETEVAVASRLGLDRSEFWRSRAAQTTFYRSFVVWLAVRAVGLPGNVGTGSCRAASLAGVQLTGVGGVGGVGGKWCVVGRGEPLPTSLPAFLAFSWLQPLVNTGNQMHKTTVGGCGQCGGWYSGIVV